MRKNSSDRFTAMRDDAAGRVPRYHARTFRLYAVGVDDCGDLNPDTTIVAPDGVTYYLVPDESEV